MAIESSVIAPDVEEEHILETYREENRQLVAERFPYAWGWFMAANGIGSFFEQQYFPERGVNFITGNVVYAILGVAVWFVIRLRPRATMLALGIATNLVIATVCLYYAQFHASAHLLVLNLLLLLAGFAAFVPCCPRSYLLSCAWIFVAYPWALGVFPVFPILKVGAAKNLPFAPLAGGVISVTPLSYDILSLISAIFIFSVGVYFLDRHRFASYRHAALASRASAIKEEFLATVSHELRTPLNVIIGYSNMLLDGATNEPSERMRLLQRIHDRSFDLLYLIQGMLDLNRLETGEPTLTIEKFQVKTVLEELHESFPPNWTKEGVQLRWEIPPPYMVMQSDKRKVEAILRNLIHNALKFTEEGSVTVSAVPQGSHSVRVSVRDTGAGIAPEDRARIFDMFQQGGQGMKHNGGVGLGLHIVKKFSEALGGTVELDSEVGTGTCIAVVLPLVAPSPDLLPQRQ